MTSSSPHHTVTPPPATGCSADPVASELPAWAPTGHRLAVPQLAHALLVPVGTASTRCPLLPRSQHRATLFTPVKLFSSTSSAKRDWNRLKRQSRNPQRVVIFALQKIQKACHTVRYRMGLFSEHPPAPRAARPTADSPTSHWNKTVFPPRQLRVSLIWISFSIPFVPGKMKLPKSPKFMFSRPFIIYNSILLVFKYSQPFHASTFSLFISAMCLIQKEQNWAHYSTWGSTVHVCSGEIAILGTAQGFRGFD